MYLNTLDVTLTPRTKTDTYNLKINSSTVGILSLILEFKVAASWHISRFLTQKDQSKYVYVKLRRMWQAGLLESFKVYSGTMSGVPVFYMLSKAGLKVLAEQGHYEVGQLKTYPHAKTLLSWGLFKHEAQVIELASLEVKNTSNTLQISCTGEMSSQATEELSNKIIEALTPDYTVLYQVGETNYCVYTEFERTQKSKDAILRKIERYTRYLSFEQRQAATVRFIFQTPSMEKSFWSNVASNQPVFLQSLRILTTNLTLLSEHTQFLGPLYISAKNGPVGDTTQRIKLFAFLWLPYTSKN